MYRFVAPIVAALAVVSTGEMAFACGTSGKIAYADTFDALGAEWPKQNEIMKLAKGELTFAETNGKSYTVYPGQSFRDVDFCATMKVTESTAVDESYGGIIFWVRDIDHFYAFQITVDGYATAFEFDGELKTMIDDTKFAAIKQGIGAVNELRVVTKGPTATFYVNDQKFDSIRVNSPPGTQHIGFTVDAPSGDKGKATFAFDNVQVRN